MTTMTLQEPPADPIEPAEPAAPAAAAEEPSLPPPLIERDEGIADGVERSLDPRAVTVDRIAGWLVIGPILAGLLVALVLVLLLTPLPGWGKAALVLLVGTVTAILAWCAQRFPAVAHRHASYKVDVRGIEIRRGVVWRKVINMPRSRVQHTDVAQGPLQRRYDLATLSIYTAGTDYAKVDLGGVDHATALSIRDHLVAAEGDDAV